VRTRERMQSVGQSLWMGDLSRALIRDGSLLRYIEEQSITGLTYSPQAFRYALSESPAYDATIARNLGQGVFSELLANRLIYEDVRYAADLLRAVYDRTDGVDGWVVLPVSPLSISDREMIVSILHGMYQNIQRPNVLLCLPALPDRIGIIENLVYAGVPINIANIYSDKQYGVVAGACLKGIERRIDDGLKPAVSPFITINIAGFRSSLLPLSDRRKATELSMAMAWKIYRTSRNLENSEQWGRIFCSGARSMRLVWACSAGSATEDADCSLYNRLIAPFTVVALPVEQIDEFILLPAPEQSVLTDGADREQVLSLAAGAGFDIDVEADRLQQDYIDWLAKEWAMLLESIAVRSAELIRAQTR